MEEKKESTFWETVKRKFGSRKFIMSLVGVIVGICGIIGCSDNSTAVIAFVALEALSILGYCLVEGHVDASAVKASTELINDVVSIIGQLKQGQEATIPEDRPSASLPVTDTSVEQLPGKTE